MNNLLGKNKILIGALVLLVVCVGGFLLLSGLFRGGGNVPITGNEQDQGRLGNIFVASQVNNQGCPVGQTNQFDSSDPIYVGVTQSEIPQGTSMFARLSMNGQGVEDTDEITADRDMNTCIWFEFTPTGGAGFDPGEYTAEVFVNGNTAGRVSFEVTGTSRQPQGGGLFDNDRGDTGGAQLGRAYTTTQVDSSGCPTDDAQTFFSDEAIYIAYQESFVPAGTEIWARLNYEDDPVEDADPLVANEDTQACFWFVFEPDSGGFNTGNYSIDVFVNGSQVESLPIQVEE